MEYVLSIIAFNMCVQTCLAIFLVYHHYNYKAVQAKFIKDTINQFMDIIGDLEQNVGTEYLKIITQLKKIS